MKTIYEVYNKYDNVIVLETESETAAMNYCNELNEPFSDISPMVRPWAVSSKIMADSYVIGEK